MDVLFCICFLDSPLQIIMRRNWNAYNAFPTNTFVYCRERLWPFRRAQFLFLVTLGELVRTCEFARDI